MVYNGETIEPATLLTMRLAITDNKYHQPHQVLAFYREVVDRIRAIRACDPPPR